MCKERPPGRSLEIPPSVYAFGMHYFLKRDALFNSPGRTLAYSKSRLFG